MTNYNFHSIISTLGYYIMESKYSYICVGYKFKSKCGYDLEVVDVYSPHAIKVVDSLGRSKVLSGGAIANKTFKWTYIDGSFCDNLGARTSRVNIGDIFDSRYYGKFEVISQEGKFYTVRFLNTDYVKHCCTTKNILIGYFCDNSVERYNQARDKFKAGTVLTNDLDEKLEVVQYNNSSEVICRWADTGEIVKYSTETLKKPSKLVRKTLERDEHIAHYIYYVYYNERVVYVGRGKGKRYLHPNSGKSSCRELNRLHFEGVEFAVKIIVDGLSYEESKKKFT